MPRDYLPFIEALNRARIESGEAQASGIERGTDSITGALDAYAKQRAMSKYIQAIRDRQSGPSEAPGGLPGGEGLDPNVSHIFGTMGGVNANIPQGKELSGEELLTMPGAENVVPEATELAKLYETVNARKEVARGRLAEGENDRDYKSKNLEQSALERQLNSDRARMGAIERSALEAGKVYDLFGPIHPGAKTDPMMVAQRQEYEGLRAEVGTISDALRGQSGLSQEQAMPSMSTPIPASAPSTSSAFSGAPGVVRVEKPKPIGSAKDKIDAWMKAHFGPKRPRPGR